MFETHKAAICEYCVSDQEYLEMMLPHADLIQDVYPGKVREYKSECVASVPAGSAIVTFPLFPKPHDIVAAIEKKKPDCFYTASTWVQEWVDLA